MALSGHSAPLRPVDDHADAGAHGGSNRTADDQACRGARRGALFNVVATG
jgi:hypothetical protein